MIYVFEGLDGASVVFDGSILTESLKAKAIILGSLPIKEEIPGKIAVLKAKKATNEVWYEYVDAPKDEKAVLEQRISDLELAITELMLS